MSDKIDIMLNSGDNISLPSWALETTQKEVLNALIALGKTTAGGVKYENEMKALREAKNSNSDA